MTSDAGSLQIGLVSRGVYPRLVGGREIFLRALAEALVRKGCRIVLATENGIGEPIPGVREVSVPTPGLAFLDLTAYSWGFARRILPAFRDVDVVHVHSPGANIFLGAWAARILGVPLVVTVHSMAAAGSRWMRITRQADAVVAVSPSVKSRLEKGGVRSERIRVIPAASMPPRMSSSRDAQRARLRLSPNNVVFVFHGRLVAGKGLEELANAFTAMSDPRARLVVVGDGPLRGMLRNRLRASIDRGTVVLVGAVPHDEIWSYLGGADVAVLPSRSEGSPLALFEAMAMGLPILAADAPGLHDFVREGDNGVLVPGDRAPDLKAAMERLMPDDVERKRLSEGALRWAKRYTIESCTDRHLELYRSLAGHNRP